MRPIIYVIALPLSFLPALSGPARLVEYEANPTNFFWNIVIMTLTFLSCCLVVLVGTVHARFPSHRRESLMKCHMYDKSVGA